MPFSLNLPIAHLSRFAKLFAKRLEKLEITTVRDLLFYYPFRYEDRSVLTPIAELVPGALATIRGTVDLIHARRSPKKRMMLTEAVVRDESGAIKVIWFRQPYVVKTLTPGTDVYLSGRVDDGQYGLQLTSPTYELAQREQIHTGRIVPVYSLTSTITQKQLRTIIKTALPCAAGIIDWLPEHIRHAFNLLDLSTAIEHIHFPETEEQQRRATHRLKFDELFLIQLMHARTRMFMTQSVAPPIRFYEDETKTFVASLPFTLTNDQRKAAWDIVQDLEKRHPMNRLLEGDVGSGKTVVSALAILNTLMSGFTVAFMAPTEILAEQHAATFIKLFSHTTFPVILRTSAKKEKILEPALIIGTHALLQKSVTLKKLGLIIIDEQHRFGVEQRATLVARGKDAGRTRNDAEQRERSSLLYESLTYTLRGLLYEIKKKLDLGHKEVVYQRAFEEELKQHHISYSREKQIPIMYRGKKIGVYRPDFVIDEKIIIEFKSIPYTGSKEKKQLWTYLKSSSFRLALLVNFGSKKLTIDRVVYDVARDSAFVPHRSAFTPHFLSMTATPIPRTLALTVYGNLDLSVIRTMPKGRQPIETSIVPPHDRFHVYAFIAEEIQKGRQAFVICPLIDPSDKLGVRAAKDEYERLSKEVFSEYTIGLLHGRMKSKEKERVMRSFVRNKIQILVSTAVVEVGVDVPNATVMMIEGAERFGLAQLHQFRGRVGRSNHQSYCFLLTESVGEKTMERLNAVVRSADGFALAEEDLKHRGPGELYGIRQSGVEDLKIASLSDVDIIEQSKKAVELLFEKDTNLDSWPLLKSRIEEWEKKVHLE